MTMSEAEFLKKLDEIIAKYSMLDHAFYQLWNKGKLSKETIQEYVKQYYAHVRNFPRYVSAVHSACDDIETRQLLLENLIEEDQGPNNHPELWMRFAEGMGVDRDAVRSTKTLRHTDESVATLRSITRSDNFLDGLGALYAYESQVPEVSRTKREGLAKFFGLNDKHAVSFFTVHEKADIVHSQVERDLISKHSQTMALQMRVLNAAEASAKALWHFLDGVYEAYVSDEVLAS